MAGYTATNILYISIRFWLILGVECDHNWLNHIYTVQTGGSVTIPCYYDEKTPLQKKYWHSAIDYTSRNTTEENLSVADHPDQSVFTVTMRNLQNKDTGHYGCVVDIQEQQTVTYGLYIKVQSVPDVSVVSSSVSGHEGVECDHSWLNHIYTVQTGGSVTIPCYYDEKTPLQKKYWHSETDHTYRNTSEENLSVIDHPDQSLFTVTMRNLQNKDTGHYGCVVDIQEQLTVTYGLYIKVQSDLDVFVVSSSVSGHEGVECDHNWLNHIYTVQTGGSVTIPCYYDEKTPPQKKYWHSETDHTYRNTTEENLSVIDEPDQSLFTVTMRNLQNKDTGHYGCVVDIQEQLTVTYGLYIKVQSAPDMFVVSSSVSGHEGGDISVQCLYSSGYQSKPKRWCRYKGQSCYTVGRTDTSQNSSVQISDDRRRSFTVLMTGLRLTDSGWYFCSAGETLNPVQLTVIKAESDTEEDTHRRVRNRRHGEGHVRNRERGRRRIRNRDSGRRRVRNRERGRRRIRNRDSGRRRIRNRDSGRRRVRNRERGRRRIRNRDSGRRRVRNRERGRRRIRNRDSGRRRIRNRDSGRRRVRNREHSHLRVRNRRHGEGRVRNSERSRLRVRNGDSGHRRVRNGESGRRRVWNRESGHRRVWNRESGHRRVRNGESGRRRIWNKERGHRRVRNRDSGRRRVRNRRHGEGRVRNSERSRLRVRNGDSGRRLVRNGESGHRRVRNREHSHLRVRNRRHGEGRVRNSERSRLRVRNGDSGRRLVRNGESGHRRVRNREHSHLRVRNRRHGEGRVRNSERSRLCVRNGDSGRHRVRNGDSGRRRVRNREREEDKHQIKDRDGSTTTDMIYSKPEDPVIYSNINDENPNKFSMLITGTNATEL
ncbi:polymeric immunoglobulin receptor-like protein [Labeo rohita]|nr:polymeric immunoglobulin receptor-like protein [Labeo rohita]